MIIAVQTTLDLFLNQILIYNRNLVQKITEDMLSYNIFR